MAQLFGPAANSIATASLYAAAGIPLLFVAGSQISRGPFNTKVGVPIDQPVPFSHKHHAKELCDRLAFCHVSVEDVGERGDSEHRGVYDVSQPDLTNSPMIEPIRSSWATNQPVKWNLVNRAPDFVYFNHALHIAKGISCNTCHGAIHEMEITWKGQAFHMAWCLDCTAILRST